MFCKVPNFAKHPCSCKTTLHKFITKLKLWLMQCMYSAFFYFLNLSVCHIVCSTHNLGRNIFFTESFSSKNLKNVSFMSNLFVSFFLLASGPGPQGIALVCPLIATPLQRGIALLQCISSHVFISTIRHQSKNFGAYQWVLEICYRLAKQDTIHKTLPQWNK